MKWLSLEQGNLWAKKANKFSGETQVSGRGALRLRQERVEAQEPGSGVGACSGSQLLLRLGLSLLPPFSSVK